MYTPIELDKTRNFRYGMVATSRIEKKFKKPMSQLDMNSLTMEDMATIMWAGLVHEDNKLTPQSVMELIDDHSNIKTATIAMGEALRMSMSGDEEDEEDEEEAKN